MDAQPEFRQPMFDKLLCKRALSLVPRGRRLAAEYERKHLHRRPRGGGGNRMESQNRDGLERPHYNLYKVENVRHKQIGQKNHRIPFHLYRITGHGAVVRERALGRRAGGCASRMGCGCARTGCTEVDGCSCAAGATVR